ncbi:MAG TPA: LuxR C-terminal-related transcriptional regulator [Acidimicrobiales bacterium]|nr:LuxR C-terminal-related transcriptional regulator [Acidimicrobiales bacterium]
MARRDSGRGASLGASLTPREGEVLSLMAERRSNAGIADRLASSAGAVEKHMVNIFAQVGLSVSEVTTVGFSGFCSFRQS